MFWLGLGAARCYLGVRGLVRSFFRTLGGRKKSCDFGEFKSL